MNLDREQRIRDSIDRAVEEIQIWSKSLAAQWREIPHLALFGYRHAEPNEYFKRAFEEFEWDLHPIRDKVKVDLSTGEIIGEKQDIVQAFLAGKLDPTIISESIMDFSKVPASSMDLEFQKAGISALQHWLHGLEKIAKPMTPAFRMKRPNISLINGGT
jgi:hypothetical protein